MESFRYEVCVSVCSKHCPNSLRRVDGLDNAEHCPIQSKSSVVVNGCKVKINDGFLFRAYLNASDFHDVDWKNMDYGRGMD